MKIKLVSDLHLEFHPLEIPNNGADLLILSGDIMTAHQSKKDASFKKFFDQISKDYPKIIYIMGNHEHYLSFFEETAGILKDFLQDYPNIQLLDNEWVEIDGIPFIGSTIWSDINKCHPISMFTVTKELNDFRLIKSKKTGRKLSSEQYVIMHNQALDFINRTLDDIGDKYSKIVICGHHAPSRASIHDNYKHDFHVNGCYASDLDNMILDNPKIVLWTHGHVHNNFDYVIGNTRIISNPRGYCNKNQNENPEFNIELLIEI